MLRCGLFWCALLSCTAPSSPAFSDAEERPPVSRRVPTVPAFPGALGPGALAQGGRGGTVLAVTSLADRGDGSLRAALEARGPRTVVFEVSGTIVLEDAIRIRSPFLTVAGQSAPGDGITIRGTDNSLIRVMDGAHDIVIRYLRLRNGSGIPDVDGHDNLTLRHGSRIIVDHVSASWASDENGGIHVGSPGEWVEDVSIQQSIFSEGLREHSNGFLIGGLANYEDPDNPIELYKRARRISLHRNLFIHNTHRNPRVTAGGAKVVNNVVYNWRYRVAATTRGSVTDHIGNYFRAGPMSRTDRIFLHDSFLPELTDEEFPPPSIYSAGNVVDPVFMDESADNWELYQLNRLWVPLPMSFRRAKPLPEAEVPVPVLSAGTAYELVLSDVGANARITCEGKWTNAADATDERLVRDVRQRTGPKEAIASPDDVGGYQDVASAQPCRDHDRDGMPDLWERAQGFDWLAPEDGAEDRDQDGYTNLEEFLNGTRP